MYRYCVEDLRNQRIAPSAQFVEFGPASEHDLRTRHEHLNMHQFLTCTLLLSVPVVVRVDVVVVCVDFVLQLFANQLLLEEHSCKGNIAHETIV